LFRQIRQIRQGLSGPAGPKTADFRRSGQGREIAARAVDRDGFDLDKPGWPADGRFQQDHRNARGRRFSTSLRIAVFPQLPVYVFIRYGVSLW